MEDVNIFPFIEVSEELAEDNKEELPMAKEYAWDFAEKDFKYKNGKMYIVEGNEAIKIWIWKLFKTNRFKDLIYSWNYGNELEDLIGRGYTQGYINSEAERYVREAIEYNLESYITSLENLEVIFRSGSLTINVTAITPYGEVEMIV